MAQHDMNIANQGFPATRADLNNALQALVSNSSGTSAPSTTFANQWWYDTTNNKMYIRNEANNAWIEVFTLDQTNNEWQLTTGVVQAKDSDGLALKTDDGTTRLFIQDSDGAIGIGSSSPKTELNIATNNSGQGPKLTLENTDTAITSNDIIGQIDFYANDASSNGTGAKVNIKAIATSTAGTITALTFGTADSTSATGSERVRINHHGLTFNGDTAAANALNDYERGTFDPVLTAATPPTSVTYTSRMGVYEKVGNIVHFTIALEVGSYSGGSGTAQVSGLPYTIGSTGDFTQNFPLFTIAQYGTHINFTRTNAVGRGARGGTFFIFRSDDNSGSTDEPISIMPTSGFFMRITGTYIVD